MILILHVDRADDSIAHKADIFCLVPPFRGERSRKQWRGGHGALQLVVVVHRLDAHRRFCVIIFGFVN